MGRMLEALKMAPPRGSTANEPQATLRPFVPELATPALEGDGEEVPFIEVGGGPGEVQASPAVLAGGSPGAKPVAPPPVTGPVYQPLAVSTVPPVPGPTAISFQPLPLTYLPPRERFASDLVAYHQPEHPVSQQYRSLLAALLAQAPSIPLQVLMFTAPIPLPGTTTVLLNLALTCARQGRERIAVIDANIERPTVAQRLGLPSCPGWCEVLAGTVPLDQALQETGQDRLQALPAGQTTGESRFASETIRAVFRQLRGQFGLVLVDAPCWDSRPDLLALGAACDAVYLVLEPGGSDLPEVKQLCHSLPRQGIPLRGCILMQS